MNITTRRYREFFQLGVEWINPSDIANAENKLVGLAMHLCGLVSSNYTINVNAVRGLSYYVKNGFEISYEELGAQSQVVGGGAYKQGIGFAIGFDRLMLVKPTT